MDKKRIYFASAAIATVSTAMLVGYAVGKKKSALPLLAGLAGLAASVAIAYQPEREARKGLVVNDLLDDHDVTLVNQNISEVLGNTAERDE